MAKRYYQGKFNPINKKKYNGDVSNIVYRSRWELVVFKWCDRNPNVRSYSSEEVIIQYFYDVDKKYHRYFVDLKVTFSNGETFLIEIKPYKETQEPIKGKKRKNTYLNESLTYIKNRNKWDAANKFAETRGWKFVIWTEKELEKLGILPNPKRKLSYSRKR